MKSFAKILFLALILSSVGSVSSHATIVLSNLSEPDLCDGSLCFGTSDTFLGGQSFTTDANSYTVNSIDVLVNLRTSTSVFVAIYSGVGGEPSAQLGTLPTFSGAVELGTFDRHSFTSDGSIMLAPLTDYWLVFGSADDANPHFQQTESLVSSGPFTLNNTRAFSSNGGTSWDITPDTSRVVKLEIDATAKDIPEPAALALFGLGLAGFGWMRRRRS